MLRKLWLASVAMAVCAGCAHAQSTVPISQLPSASAPLSGAELLPCVQGGVTKSCTPGEIYAVGQAAHVILSGGSYSLAWSDHVVIIKKTSGSATTVNLPSSPVTGQAFTIKDGKGDAETNPITLTPSSALIDGLAHYVINYGYGVVTLVFDGTNWDIIG